MFMFMSFMYFIILRPSFLIGVSVARGQVDQSRPLYFWPQISVLPGGSPNVPKSTVRYMFITEYWVSQIFQKKMLKTALVGVNCKALMASPSAEDQKFYP